MLLKSSGSPIASLRTLSEAGDNLLTDPILWTEVFTKEKIAAEFVKSRSFVGEDDTISLASSVTGKDIEEDTSKAEGAKEGPKQSPLSSPRSELDPLRPKFPGQSAGTSSKSETGEAKQKRGHGPTSAKSTILRITGPQSHQLVAAFIDMLQSNAVSINTVSLCQACLNNALFPAANLEAISENLDIKMWEKVKADMKSGPSNRLEASQQLQYNIASIKSVLANVKIEPYAVTSQLVAAIIGQMIQSDKLPKNVLKTFITTLERDPRASGQRDAIALLSIMVHLMETWVQSQPWVSHAPLPQEAIAKNMWLKMEELNETLGNCPVLGANLDALKVTAVAGAFPNYQSLFNTLSATRARILELSVAKNYNLGIGTERQKYTLQEIAEYYDIDVTKLSSFSGSLDYRPDFTTYSDDVQPTLVYVLEVSSRKLPEERRSELFKRTREFCELCNPLTEDYSFVPILVHLPSGPAMSETIDALHHFSSLDPDLKASIKAAFKSLNFLMQYTLNKCSPDFCNRVIMSGEMGAAPLQSREMFVPPPTSCILPF